MQRRVARTCREQLAYEPRPLSMRRQATRIDTRADGEVARVHFFLSCHLTRRRLGGQRGLSRYLQLVGKVEMKFLRALPPPPDEVLPTLERVDRRRECAIKQDPCTIRLTAVRFCHERLLLRTLVLVEHRAIALFFFGWCQPPRCPPPGWLPLVRDGAAEHTLERIVEVRRSRNGREPCAGERSGEGELLDRRCRGLGRLNDVLVGLLIVGV
mmetsp:Transcript_29498/g.50489  ORF Transcript_29498/g.50489 Transcript_29498/m.50489 type:complete len:212 (+) Transcript_29498:334-969(+)